MRLPIRPRVVQVSNPGAPCDVGIISAHALSNDDKVGLGRQFFEAPEIPDLKTGEARDSSDETNAEAERNSHNSLLSG